MIPIAGSAYTYAYATLGEIFAWIIGWDLILEYAVSNMAVAVGFSAYFNDILEALFGFHLPKQLSEPMIAGGQLTGSYFNLPALADHHGAHMDPGARRAGKRRRQQRDGGDQDRRDPDVRLRRRRRRQDRQLASLHAERILRA